MAFDSTERSNIYDGPMALTKERDACGVGFVANPKEGECVELPFVGGSNQIETNQPWFLFPGIYLFTPTTNYLI